ncbi:PREDICTED: uncharacterized protein LOC109244494 [Nicotiana attenuata]|uniref:uncharacterized protein LOC109244494 n=1 Tax=Nicotiana attenuata TaxID=49451 RepID=UPI000905A971|nr:PREDICTED: uncharacterized protein LOC109244494 [Nicotiana attenuata]
MRPQSQLLMDSTTLNASGTGNNNLWNTNGNGYNNFKRNYNQQTNNNTGISAFRGSYPQNRPFLKTYKDKFEPRSTPHLFVGYPFGAKGYKVLNLATTKIHVSIDVIFHEHVFPFSLSSGSKTSIANNIIPRNIGVHSSDETNISASTLRRSAIIPHNDIDTLFTDHNSMSTQSPNTSFALPKTQPNHIVPSSNTTSADSTPSFSFITSGSNAQYISLNALTHDSQQLVTNISFDCEPGSYEEASQDPAWQAAMTQEFEVLYANHTWDLVLLPAGKRAIGCKWVYKVKHKADGTVERLKARLLSRQWYAKLTEALCSRGYTHSMLDYSLFSKKKGNYVIFVAVYVDDVILTGKDTEEILSPKRFLDQTFKIKYLGKLHYFLGMEVLYTAGGVLLTQRKSAQDLLKEHHCLSCSSMSSPLNSSTKHRADDGSPRDTHLRAAFHVLRYLKGDPSLGIFFSSTRDYTVKAFCDSDWAACYESRRSVSGFVILLGSTPISWKSKKQSTVSLSSSDVEYRSARQVVGELVCQASLQIARNPVFHEKHIKVDCHFVRDELNEWLVDLHYISTHEELADIFTKSLTGLKHSSLLGKLAMSPSPPT